MKLEDIIKQLKDISLEDLSEEELEQLKDILIKILVDVQLQKDISAKMKSVHLSTDDMEIKMMQELEDKNTLSDAEELVTIEKSHPDAGIKDEHADEVQYSDILKETVSEEVISIYTTAGTGSSNEPIAETISVNSGGPNVSDLKKIVFSINDKFRILKKLFRNDSSAWDTFLQELNTIDRFAISEDFIEKQKEHYGWDEHWEEYKILLRQNKKRFQ